MPGVLGVRVGSSPLCMSLVSLPLGESRWAWLAPDHVSALPALFRVASSLHLAVENLSANLQVVFWVISTVVGVT